MESGGERGKRIAEAETFDKVGRGEADVDGEGEAKGGGLGGAGFAVAKGRVGDRDLLWARYVSKRK